MSAHDTEWADIPDWPHQASKLTGEIRRKPWRDADGCLHLGGEVAACPDKRKGKGYLYATLRDGQRRRKAHVAVLVLEAHRGLKPGPEYEACHGNGIRTDNRLCNLAWKPKLANLAEMWEQRRAMTDTPALSSAAGQRADVASPICHRSSVTSDRPHGTGRSPIPYPNPSQSTSVQPRSRTLRTSFRSLRDLLAA